MKLALLAATSVALTVSMVHADISSPYLQGPGAFVGPSSQGPMAFSGSLFSQGPHTPGETGANGISTFYGNIGATFYDRQIADDFTITDDAWELKSAQIHGVWFDGGFTGTPDFNVRIFDASSGPGALVFETTVSSSRTTGPGIYFGRPEQIYTLDFDAKLDSGTYFFSAQPIINEQNLFWLTANGSATPPDGSEMFIRDLSGNTGGWPSDGTWAPGSSAFGTEFDLAFSLFGSVQVPAPGALALLGLAGLVGTSRRRR